MFFWYLIFCCWWVWWSATSLRCGSAFQSICDWNSFPSKSLWWGICDRIYQMMRHISRIQSRMNLDIYMGLSEKSGPPKSTSFSSFFLLKWPLMRDIPHFQTHQHIFWFSISQSLPNMSPLSPMLMASIGIHWHPLASLSPYLRWWQRDHHLVSMRTAAWRLLQGDSKRWWLKDHRASGICGMEHCWEAPNFWWSWFSQLIFHMVHPRCYFQIQTT